MATSFPQPGYAQPQSPPKSRKTLSIFLLIALGVFVIFGFWECGSSVYSSFHDGWTEASAAGHHFHEELNAGQFEQVAQEADPDFQTPDKHDQLLKFLSVVHRKLGKATS